MVVLEAICALAAGAGLESFRPQLAQHLAEEAVRTAKGHNAAQANPTLFWPIVFQTYPKYSLRITAKPLER